MWEDIFLPLLLPWIFLYGVASFMVSLEHCANLQVGGKKEKELDVKLWWQFCLFSVGSDNVRDTWEGETPAGGMTQKLVGDCLFLNDVSSCNSSLIMEKKIDLLKRDLVLLK